MEKETKPIDNGNKSELQDPNTGRFLPGNPGGGRPKGAKNLTTKVKEALEKIGKTADGKEMTYESALVQKILDLAINQGNPRMIELLWNYLDGKPLQRLEADYSVRTLEDLLKEDEDQIEIENETEKNQPTIDRGTTEDTQQEGTASTIQTEQSSEVLLGENDEKKSDTQGTAEGNQ